MLVNVRGKICWCNSMLPGKNSGVVLIVVLWILVILSMLAIGLGRKSSVELALAKYSIDKLKSKYIAMAGLVYAMEKIRKGSNNKGSNKTDTRFQCGFALEDGQSVEDIFKNIGLKDGYFDIYYSEGVSSSGKSFRYGFTDEESKININTIGPDNQKVLSNLIAQFNYEEGLADTLAEAVIQWRDRGQNVFSAPFSAGDRGPGMLSQENLPSLQANLFGSVDELMLVDGMTQEIYDKIKKYVTVFPEAGRFLVNVNTAERPVLVAFARNFSGNMTNTTMDDADSLADKIINYRYGDDGVWATADDRVVDHNEMALVAKERAIFLSMMRHQTKVSRYLRVRVKGTDATSSVVSNIEAVVRRDDLSLVYWKRN